jgi:uncharacterized OB-fold protein
MSGKGDRDRTKNHENYKRNYDKAFGMRKIKDERCGKCGRMFWHHIKAKMNMEV